MSDVVEFNLAIELFSSLLCLVYILSILVGRDTLGRLDRTFILGALLNIAAMTGDGMSVLVDGRSDQIDFWLNRTGHLLAYTCTYFLLMIFGYYVSLFFLPRHKNREGWLDLVYGACLLGILSLVANLYFGFYYWIDSQNQYQLGPFYWLSQIIGVTVLLILGGIVLKRRETLSRNEFRALLIFVAVPTIAVLLQLLVYGFVTVWIASTVTLTLIFFGTLSRQGQQYREQKLVLQELTERAHKLDEANHLLDSVNHMKTRLLSTVSHEMNTPLSVISANAQLTKALLSQGESGPSVYENLDLIAEESQRLSRLAKGIVKLSTLQEAHEDQRWVDFRELLTKTVTAYRPLLKKGVKMRLVLPKELPLLQGDYDMLVQVMMNLLSNSLRYTDQGEIQVIAEATDKQLTIMVKDTGSGIDPELLPHVFERRVKDTKSGNHGIGLTVCQEIIQQHHGKMQITSRLGQGTRVTFSLPLNRESTTYGKQNTIS